MISSLFSNLKMSEEGFRNNMIINVLLISTSLIIPSEGL